MQFVTTISVVIALSTEKRYTYIPSYFAAGISCLFVYVSIAVERSPNNVSQVGCPLGQALGQLSALHGGTSIKNCHKSQQRFGVELLTS